jgi:ubiquinol-cytochrome c reductase cytochrome c1 subunit
MKLMKKLLMVLALLPVLAVASEGGYPLDHAPDRSRQLPALQNGAKLFVNYCLNCHAASLVRYNRLRDIGLSEPQIRDNLLFTSDKVGDLMKTAMNEKDAKAWFGAVPPDLSVLVRAKSSSAGSGAGTTLCIQMLECRMCCGSCKACARPNLLKKKTRMKRVRLFTGSPVSNKLLRAS